MFRAVQMSRFFVFALMLLAPALLTGAARAQDLQIQFPQEGQEVRGEITVRFTGVPDGGYAVVKLDGNFVSAVSGTSFLLNTFDLKSLSPNLPNEGTHRLSITGINAGGKRVGEKIVSFEVANARQSAGGEGVYLLHYEDWMRLDPNVQRYRVFAESNASDSRDMAKGGGGAGGGGGGGEEWLPAPLDWQISALMRREVRDIGGWSDTRLTADREDDISSANIRTVVQTAYQRQRQSEGKGGEEGEKKTTSRKKKKISSPTKAPWRFNERTKAPEWEEAPEIGQYFVKNIEPSGKEINATRKAPTIALADLLPTFPDAEVRPGSTWETRMTFISDLSSRQPLNFSVPISFTSFENIQTPAGFNRRAAKLESRFQMPDQIARKMAVNLILQTGKGEGGGDEGGDEGGATPSAGAAGTGAAGGKTTGAAPGSEGSTKKKTQTADNLPAEELADYLASIRSIGTRASRVLWFDVQNHRVLRSEDTIRASFSFEPLEGEGGGGGVGGEGGEVEPVSISYNLVVTTWFDDTVPGVHDKYVSSAGTAHSRDNATDPTIEKINKPVAP